MSTPSSDSDDDSDEGELFGIHLFGPEAHAVGGNDLATVTKNLALGLQPTAAAVLFACYTGAFEVLDRLLKADGDANARMDIAKSDDHAQQWRSDVFEEAQLIREDKQQWYAVQFSTCNPYWALTVEQTQEVMKTLLSHGLDIYRTYHQSLQFTLPFPYPGEGRDPSFSHIALLRQLWSAEEEEGSKAETLEAGRSAGLISRTIIHSLFEDGGSVVPFLPTLDTEHRDPLGRTIIHAACRSCLGADAPITEYLSRASNGHKLTLSNPSVQSIFEAVRLRGADLDAVDHSGRSIHHHLLEAHAPHAYSQPPPSIRTTLLYILQHRPHLLEQSNNHGLRPLHCALQRLAFYKESINGWGNHDLEDAVIDILDAGASPCSDGRGNTPLHYLVGSGLIEPWLGQSV